MFTFQAGIRNGDFRAQQKPSLKVESIFRVTAIQNTKRWIHTARDLSDNSGLTKGKCLIFRTLEIFRKFLLILYIELSFLLLLY